MLRNFVQSKLNKISLNMKWTLKLQINAFKEVWLLTVIVLFYLSYASNPALFLVSQLEHNK